jgi:hypothetical protein
LRRYGFQQRLGEPAIRQQLRVNPTSLKQLLHDGPRAHSQQFLSGEKHQQIEPDLLVAQVCYYYQRRGIAL